MELIIQNIPLIVLCIIAYLIGSVPFGLMLAKMAGHGDIREIGSGNIGATNVLRTGNKKLALTTLTLDAGKGGFVSHLYFWMQLSLASAGDIVIFDYKVSLTLVLFAIIGHCFPIWLKFKGGKGVATALGALLAAVPLAGLAALITWIISALIFRVSSLAALIAAAIAPIVTYYIYGKEPAFICALITLLIFIRHKDNIKRIIKGTEPKIGGNKDAVQTK